MTVATLTLDGRPVSARDGETLLEVCREHGVPLPTLCHLDGLSDVGACRLCLVEVAGAPRPLPACTTAAREGMEVVTDTPRLRSHRRAILELLLAEGNHVCAARGRAAPPGARRRRRGGAGRPLPRRLGRGTAGRGPRDGARPGRRARRAAPRPHPG